MATALYAMAINFDVTTESGLAHLDSYLLTCSFVTGHQPSRDDILVFTAIGLPPRSTFVNLSRWYAHIEGLIQRTFPGASEGVVFDRLAIADAEGDAVREVTSVRAPSPAATGGHETNLSAGLHVENENYQNGDSSLDLFGQETREEAEALAARLRETGVPASEGRVSGKSSILLDVKPWDDETDMEALERAVRAVQLPGLHWGASKLEPVAFKIRKLQIMMTIEDDLVSPDSVIEEHLTAPPANEHIQSCDIAAWNKICKMNILLLWIPKPSHKPRGLTKKYIHIKHTSSTSFL